MPIYKRDLPEMEKGAQSLRDLIVGHQQKLAEQQNEADVSVGKAKQMVPIEAQAAGAKQGAQNDANMRTYQDFAKGAPDGASVKVGDLSVGVDPALKYAQQQRGMSDKAIKDATDLYNR